MCLVGRHLAGRVCMCLGLAQEEASCSQLDLENSKISLWELYLNDFNASVTERSSTSVISILQDTAIDH